MSSSENIEAGRRVRPKRRRLGWGQENRTAYLMIAPMVILLGIFVFWPLVYSFWLSLHSINFYQGNQWVGFHFYKQVLADVRFWRSIRVGAYYTCLVVPIGMLVALLIASFIKTLSVKMATFMKTTVYVPTVISSVVTSLLFMLMYQQKGIVNAVLAIINVGPVTFLNSPKLVIPALAAPGIWMGLGITTLIMLAGLLDIPESYYESAMLDGAGFVKRTIYVTLPLLRNVLLYLFVTGIVAAMQLLDLPLIMTGGGGPVGASTTPNMFIFNMFRDTTPFARSFSLTAALLLFVVLGTVSALVFRLVNSEKAVDA